MTASPQHLVCTPGNLARRIIWVSISSVASMTTTATLWRCGRHVSLSVSFRSLVVPLRPAAIVIPLGCWRELIVTTTVMVRLNYLRKSATAAEHPPRARKGWRESADTTAAASPSRRARHWSFLSPQCQLGDLLDDTGRPKWPLERQCVLVMSGGIHPRAIGLPNNVYMATQVLLSHPPGAPHSTRPQTTRPHPDNVAQSRPDPRKYLRNCANVN